MPDPQITVKPTERPRGAIGIVFFALALAAGVLIIQLMLPGL